MINGVIIEVQQHEVSAVLMGVSPLAQLIIWHSTPPKNK
jgi:hypothetical protein